MSFSSGELIPSFSEAITDYSVAISDIPSDFTVTATTAYPFSTMEAKINAEAFVNLASGQVSPLFTPNLGSNSFLIKVTAEDGTVKNYNIAIDYGVCAAGYFSNENNSCVPVTIGYWSADNDNTRTACTNKPENSRYTSPTASDVNCPWSCNDGFITTDGQSCVGYPNAQALYCNDDEVAVGLYGRSGSILDRLGVRCAILNPDGTFGAVRAGPTYGGNGGGPFNYDGSFDCPDGSTIHRINGNWGIFNGQDRTGRIRFNCKDMQNQDISSWRPSNGTYWGSGQQRAAFDYSCGSIANPYGQFINGIIIDNAGGAAYTGDILGITCR